MSLSVLSESKLPLPNVSIEVSGDLTPRYTWNERFRSESERLKTFENWPLEWLDKNVLAATGMFYTGEQDMAKCYFCEIIIHKWEESDDPVKEHLRWSPNCPLLKRRTTNNIPLNEKNLDLILPPSKYSSNDTPPARVWKPIPCQDLSLKNVRFHTFSEWPRSLKQRPEEMVEAGFYYKGTGDCVICFSCLGGLKDWEEDDDPWEQHALWMGHFCPYVKLMKGEDYIQSVYEKFKNYNPQEMNRKETKIKVPEKKSSRSEESEDKLCKICFEKECNTAYVPCGHVVACVECALTVRNCPVCRASIENVVRLYFA